MIRILHRVLPFILLFLLSNASFAAQADLESRIRKITLTNGMRVLLLHRPLSPTVSFNIRQLSGAVDEIGGKTGTAHLLEHMLFKGTTTIGTLDDVREGALIEKIKNAGRRLDSERLKGGRADSGIVEALSAELKSLQEEHRKLFIANEMDRIYTENGAESMNAGTGQDLTTYYVSLPANKIELWARIESDRMQNPVFREFYTERDVITEERRQRIEINPKGRLAEQFFAAAFRAHPYGRPILGWPSDIGNLNMDDVASFHLKARDPRRTVIAVAGDIDIEETLAVIRKYFEAIPAPSTQPPVITEEPLQTGERRVEVLFDAKPQLIMGYHKPPPPAHDDYVFDMIEAILSHGRSSRLYRKLVEGLKLAESVDTANGVPGSRYPNLFAVFATPRHPHECRELESAINEELEKLKQTPIGDQELRKVKNQMKAAFIRSLNANGSLASMLSYYEVLLDDYRYLTNHIHVIDRITSEDIMRTAQKFLNRENRTVATLVSKKKVSAAAGETKGRASEHEK
jgi:predicted Zn-dependent peptidase